ncbi:MAG: cytochrome c3 family protein [Proteobacteria bacterium]|nr:cytochrome c3 family protein [Pseudomonadota bacterium]
MSVIVLILGLAGVVYGMRDAMIRARPLLPVAFEHLDHASEKCTLCHHNYIDDTGYDSCYSCHKNEPDIALSIEPMFHDFCRDCHIEKAQLGEASGPFRICAECHNADGRMSQNLATRTTIRTQPLNNNIH